MLQNISEEIRQCYHNAADCVRKVEIVQDERYTPIIFAPSEAGLNWLKATRLGSASRSLSMNTEKA